MAFSGDLGLRPILAFRKTTSKIPKSLNSKRFPSNRFSVTESKNSWMIRWCIWQSKIET